VLAPTFTFNSSIAHHPNVRSQTFCSLCGVPVQRQIDRPMKWIIKSLEASDNRARDCFLDNISVHLKRSPFLQQVREKLLHCDGSYSAIVFDNLDLDLVAQFRFGGSYGGVTMMAATAKYAADDVHYPEGGLASIIANHLGGSRNGVALSYSRSNTLEPVDWPESLKASLGEDVVHFLPAKSATLETVNELVSDSRGMWTVGVCSTVASLPAGAQWPVELLDEIISNASQLFTPAFDGEGYLVWTENV
jgi:hypothetical protein